MLDLRSELGEWGWATSHFKWESGSLDFRTSYLSEPIHNLADQARWLADPLYRINREWPDAVDFSDEPGHLRLTVTHSSDLLAQANSFWQIKDEVLDLQLKEWDDTWPGSGEPADVLHLSTQMKVGDYVFMIFRELTDIWEDYGMVGYDRCWIAADFPVEDYALIGHFLGAARPTSGLWKSLPEVWLPRQEETDV